jgi:hypothetical protein
MIAEHASIMATGMGRSPTPRGPPPRRADRGAPLAKYRALQKFAMEPGNLPCAALRRQQAPPRFHDRHLPPAADEILQFWRTWARFNIRVP